MSNKLFLFPSVISPPLQNGVGRYIGQLQRVVLKFCKNHGSSRGMRDFIESGLVNFAKVNPGVVVYLKPRRHRSPVIKAEYLNGDTQWLCVRGVSQEDILKWLILLNTQSKNTTGTRLRHLTHTDHPSIQGPWTPYTFRDPKLNLAQFPNEELAQPEDLPKSAEQELVEIYKRQKIEDEECSRAE